MSTRIYDLLVKLAALDQPHNHAVPDNWPIYAMNGACITAGDARMARMMLQRRRSYHDLHVTCNEFVRTPFFNLPFGLTVSCNRTTGWTLEQFIGTTDRGTTHHRQIASEFSTGGLVLDIEGIEIVKGLEW